MKLAGLATTWNLKLKRTDALDETREKIRAKSRRFTPCTAEGILLQAVTEAAQCATGGDVVLLSPGCSSFDRFQNYQHQGEMFHEAMRPWVQQRELFLPVGKHDDAHNKSKHEKKEVNDHSGWPLPGNTSVSKANPQHTIKFRVNSQIHSPFVKP